MESVAVVYIGLPRYESIGRQNHKILLSKLREKYNVVEYNFLQPLLDRSTCPFNPNEKGAARIQIWDFYTALDAIQERFVIKLRTDVWFAKSSTQVVLAELENIVAGKHDISYMGLDIIYNPSATNLKMACDNLKVLDLVILVDRLKIVRKDIVFSELQKGKLAAFKSGNSTWRCIWTNKTRAFIIGCQLYLIRKEYNEFPNDWDVAYDFVHSYPHMEPAKLMLDQNRKEYR
jgi:hypothetical protein